MGPDQIIRRDAVDTGRTYLCIDLKSFYASVECVDRGLDPFKDNLVVADPERSRTTICLAASPAIKALGVPSRCRVYEIPKNIQYTMAPPRMKRYMEVSAQIYGIYLRRISAQDIHVYSIDECFIDATPYLSLYRTDARSLAQQLMDDVREECGICATAGIGTNLFLAKVALDVTAKHVDDHIGYLDEREFRRKIWHHRPITDIWQIGPNIARRLEQRYDVRDLAGIVAMDEATLRREFGVGATHLMEHARGIENCAIAQIQSYKPQQHSISVGQVLTRPYMAGEALTVMREMVDEGVLELVDKRLACGHVSIWAGYHMTDLDWELAAAHRGPHAAASHKLVAHTSSREALMDEVERLWGEAIDEGRMVKRLGLGFGALIAERDAELTLFTDVEAERSERRLTQATIAVKQRFGKNALVRGRSFREEATGRDRNAQVGGHNA